MKKFIWTGITIASMLFSICGCGSNDVPKVEPNTIQTVIGENETNVKKTAMEESSSNESDTKIQQNDIAYELMSNGDYNKLAADLSELVQDSDLILKIKVESVNAFVNDNGMIQTEITPLVQEIYKGSYHDEKLYVNGGEMLYDEFIQNEIIKKLVSGHEGPNDKEMYSGKYVRQCVDNQYIFNCGEEYIFFARKRVESDKYYSLYAYQGTFRLNNGMVENTALNETDFLKQDIDIIFNIQSQTSEKNGVVVSEQEFSEKLRAIINSSF